jgi:membrane-associated phospholipid phosphatase
MLQSILSLDTSLLISARTLVGPEYALMIQLFGESVVVFVGIMLIGLWLYGVKTKDDEYKKNALRIFTTIILVFIVYGVINLWVPQWRPSPDEVAGGIAPLIPHPIGNSFPSGHALFSAATLVALWRYYRNTCIIVLFVLLALMTTSARVIGGVHYPGDIVGGFFFGLFGAILLGEAVTSRVMEERIYPFFIRVGRWIKL